MDSEPAPASNWQFRLINYLLGPQAVIQLATTKFLAEEGDKDKSLKPLKDELESSMTMNSVVGCVGAFFVNELLKSRFKRYGGITVSAMILQVSFATTIVGGSCALTMYSYSDKVEIRRKEMILSHHKKYLKWMKTINR